MKNLKIKTKLFLLVVFMLIGMVAGAYSSVCLAGPLWATWQNYKAAQNKQK